MCCLLVWSEAECHSQSELACEKHDSDLAVVGAALPDCLVECVEVVVVLEFLGQLHCEKQYSDFAVGAAPPDCLAEFVEAVVAFGFLGLIDVQNQIGPN